VGLLDGDIAALMGDVMGQFYLDATLRTVTLVDDGSGGGTTTSTTQAVKVQEDRITEEARLAGGYSQLAKRFIVLQAGTSGPLTGDSELTVGGVTYMLSAPEQDPAKAYWYVVGVPK
jgi:hypothetical protein